MINRNKNSKLKKKQNKTKGNKNRAHGFLIDFNFILYKKHGVLIEKKQHKNTVHKHICRNVCAGHLFHLATL